MNVPLSMQPEQIQLAAGRFTETGNDLLTTLTRTRRALDALGTPWGEDDPGKAFARDYLPDASNTVEVIGLLAGALSGIATGLHQMATTTVEFDHTTATTTLTQPVPSVRG
jgi:hypothetical protein